MYTNLLPYEASLHTWSILFLPIGMRGGVEKGESVRPRLSQGDGV